MKLDKFIGYLLGKKVRGSTFFHQRIPHRRRLKIKTKRGILLALDPNEYVDRFVIDHGYYESEVLEAIMDHLPENGCFWDVGANIGLHAVTVACLKPETKVFCFEPNPKMAERIRENADLNKANVKIVQNALGNSNREVSLYLHSGNAGMSSVHNWNEDKSLKKIEVELRRADELCLSQAATPSVVKIDVEGAEYEVLEGMQGILDSKQIKAIIFEDSREDSAGKQLLKAKGFRITQLERNEPTHHNLENYLAVK